MSSKFPLVVAETNLYKGKCGLIKNGRIGTIGRRNNPKSIMKYCAHDRDGYSVVDTSTNERINPMDTSAAPDSELRKATVACKKNPGYRCPGRQRDGNYALSVGIPTACFSGEQLHQLADLVDRYAKVGHFSTAQSLIIVGIPEDQYYEARQAVLDAGFDVRSIGRDVRQVKCCPGADFSPFGLQRTLPLATALEETFRGLPTPIKFKISVSGCPNCCANTKMNDFGIHGTVDGWKVFVGGKMGNIPAIAQEIASSVSSDDVPRYLAAVLRTYKEEAGPDERLAKTLQRVGLSVFSEHVAQYLDTPYDDLVAMAKEAREAAERSKCLGALGGQ
jgi:dissimilatory sulfite reductase (desulfoviridin) alpha/beta subunit